MIGVHCGVLAMLLLVGCAAASGGGPQAVSSSKPVSMLDLMGIKLPEGEELAPMIAKAERYPLGSRDNPVRAAGIGGQRAYLSRLRCADGSRPRFQRTAVAEKMGPFGRISDGYAVICGAERREVFLDMYHEHVEDDAIPGFSIVAAAVRN